MSGRPAKRLGLLIAVMLVLYFVFTSSAVHTAVGSAGDFVRGLFGYKPVTQPPVTQPPTTETPTVPTNIVYHAAESTTPANSTRLTLYFADADGMFLVPVTRTVSLSRTPVRDSLSELIRGPVANSGLISPFIEMAVRDLALQADGTLRIDLPAQVVQASAGWGSSASLIALESMVNTVSEISAVKRVVFLVAGKATSTLFHGLSAKDPIPAQKWQSTGGRVTLYYAIYAGNRAYLVPEQIDVTQTGAVAQLRHAIEQLKQGRNSGQHQLHPTLPTNVNILGLDVANRVATINLSSEFATVFEQTPAKQALTVDSLVFTATAFPEVDRVQLLVDGQKLQRMVGKHDLSKPLDRHKWVNPE